MCLERRWRDVAATRFTPSLEELAPADPSSAQTGRDRSPRADALSLHALTLHGQ